MNVPLAVAYDTLDFDSMNFATRHLIDWILSHQSFFFTATPYELIFAGKVNALSCIAHLIDPKKNPDCSFAYFTGQNNTNDGLWEINTGYDNIRDINSILTLNGSSHIDIWDGEQCNRIEGASNGEIFSPLDVVTGPQKTLQFFRSDFCRVFNLTLEEVGIPAEVGGSLTVDRFRPAEKMFANATVNPINTCYRPNPNKTNDQSDGVHVHTMVKFLQQKGFHSTLLNEVTAMLSGNESKRVDCLVCIDL